MPKIFVFSELIVNRNRSENLIRDTFRRPVWKIERIYSIVDQGCKLCGEFNFGPYQVNIATDSPETEIYLDHYSEITNCHTRK
jgi:hypothetical protein